MTGTKLDYAWWPLHQQPLTTFTSQSCHRLPLSAANCPPSIGRAPALVRTPHGREMNPTGPQSTLNRPPSGAAPETTGRPGGEALVNLSWCIQARAGPRFFSGGAVRLRDAPPESRPGMTPCAEHAGAEAGGKLGTEVISSDAGIGWIFFRCRSGSTFFVWG